MGKEGVSNVINYCVLRDWIDDKRLITHASFSSEIQVLKHVLINTLRLQFVILVFS